MDYPLRDARLRAGWSLARVAVEAGCSITTANKYEYCPDSVAPRKRATLAKVYARIARVAPKEK